MSEDNKSNFGDYLRGRMRDAGVTEPDGIDEIWEDQKKAKKSEKKTQKNSKKISESAKQAISRSTSSQLFLGVRSKARPVIASVSRTYLTVKDYIKRKPKRAAALFAVLLLATLVTQAVFISGESKDMPSVQGTSIDQEGDEDEGDALPVEEPTDFELLYPKNADRDQLEVVRVSPPDEENPTYAYTDHFEGSNLIVSQQSVGGNFDTWAVAESFQATNVIEVDGNEVYHGYSEVGNVQSLIFVKEEILVLIRSEIRLDDASWALYYLQLQ